MTRDSEGATESVRASACVQEIRVTEVCMCMRSVLFWLVVFCWYPEDRKRRRSDHHALRRKPHRLDTHTDNQSTRERILQFVPLEVKSPHHPTKSECLVVLQK